MKLTILRNDPHVPPGHLERVARARGVEVDLVSLDEGQLVPDLRDVDAVVVLGGEMGAYDTDAYPYLVDEKRFLVAAVAEDIPILGVCLGCQLLADALGGEAYLAATPEVEIGPLLATAQDPVVDVLTNGPTFTIHRDTWDIPPGGTLVARSRMYNQAFRFGSALGVQPHPEADASIVEAWLSHERGSAVVGAAGGDPDAVLADFHAVAEEVSRLADEFFGAWLEEAETASMSRTS